jgi:formylglycine-generating enzyme required for sulfatase activity
MILIGEFKPNSKNRLILIYFWMGLVFSLFGCQESKGVTTNTPILTHTNGQAQYDEPPFVTETPLQEGKQNGDNANGVNPIDGAAVVYVPPGEFEMGAEPAHSFEICIQYRDGCDLTDFADEEPVHVVTLDGYWIYQNEVTNSNYRQCVEAGGCSFPAFTNFYNHTDYPDHPVVYVSWDASAVYCEWAGGRLPTEAEWEKAARGFDGRMFPWGEEEVACSHANLSGCSAEMTAPVGRSPMGASPYGALDMAGNVSEWVFDWYAPDYYSVSAEHNPIGPETGEMKVIRGGSWKNPGVGLRSTNRSANFPEVFSTGIGFRCVLDSN